MTLFSKIYGMCSQDTRVSMPNSISKEFLRFSRTRRREIISQTKKGCAPLFLACKNGHLNLVKFLLYHCDADVEQKGVFQNYHTLSPLSPASETIVSPLGCATIAGHLEIVKFLYRFKANINSTAGICGSTLVSQACLLNRVGVVSFLVNCGANIHKPNHQGVTCLMFSVHDTDLCQFLLENGAEINVHDRHRRTAMHYAIRNNQLRTFNLFLASGADPFFRCYGGNDALQTACLYQTPEIFEHLCRNVTYDAERLADAYELFGALLLFADQLDHLHFQRYLKEGNQLLHPTRITLNRLPETIARWRKACEIRHEAGVTKEISLRPLERIFEFTREFRDEEELENILLLAGAHEAEAVNIQALHICERVLGRAHEDWQALLMARGELFKPHPKSIDAFLYLLRIKVGKKKGKGLSLDVIATVRELVSIFYSRAIQEDDIDFEDARRTLSIMKRIVQYHSTEEDLQGVFDMMLNHILTLIFILLKISRSENEKQATFALVSSLLSLNFRTFLRGDSLLHLAMEMEINLTHFPTLQVSSLTSFLLLAGADVNATNNRGCSPLMYSIFRVVETKSEKYQKIIKILLEARAHIDQVMFGKTISEHVGFRKFLDITGTKVHINLQCLAARAIRRYHIPYAAGRVSSALEIFIGLH